MYSADSVTQISLRRRVIQHGQCQTRDVIDKTRYRRAMSTSHGLSPTILSSVACLVLQQ